MSKIQYKLLLPDGHIEQGAAKSIFVKDELNILTILDHYAPLIAVLQNGAITISSLSNEEKTYDYADGFLKCQNDLCNITLLK